jgi:uncharacterized protein YjiK
MKAFLFVLFFFILFAFYEQRDNNITRPGRSIGYDLSVPFKVYILPGELKEISGMAETDTTAFACIQDEKEIVYIFDINKSQVIKKLNLGYTGDFEGIARVDKTLYILRSDGVISEIADFDTDQPLRTTYSTGIPWKDNEGICSDPNSNRLLIAPKMAPEKSSGNKKKRFIYGFDLISKKLLDEPVITFDLDEIEKFVHENKIKVPTKDKKKGGGKEPDIKFRMSAIEIHPLTGKLFVLSSFDKLLFVFNMKGEIEFVERLNPEIFHQPEGITFMKNGDLYISNEGKKKSPTLVRFKYKP